MAGPASYRVVLGMTNFLLVALSVLFLGSPVGAFLSSTPLQCTYGNLATICHKPLFGTSNSALRRSPTLRMAAGGPTATDSSFLNHPLAALLAECKDFGLVRFISVNPSGSVLETAGSSS
jgi:hypothetical protein